MIADVVRTSDMTLVRLNAKDPQEPLQSLIRLTGLRADQAVCVAGPDSLEALAELCQAGFDRVACARQATGAGADAVADLLILTGASDTLGALCARTAPLLRDGGLVAAWIGGAEDGPAIRTALIAHGMEVSTWTQVCAQGRLALHRAWRHRRLAQAS